MMEYESRLFSIIKSPVVSEKSTTAGEKHNTIVFKCVPDASKDEIRRAVEKIFNVKVASVTTLKVHGKPRRTAHGMGRRSDWKKAYVTLGENQNIDFSAGVKTEENK